MQAEPKADRPHIPGYGVSTSADGLLPWSWAVERLSAARNYYVATVRPDQRPHVMPVWGIWLDNAFWFSTGLNTTKVRNLSHNAHGTVCTEGAVEAVIVQGTIAPVAGGEPFARFAGAYKAKYDWTVNASEGPAYVLTPNVAFGIIEHADQFGETATRWRFT
jgi:hypothetical protein